MAEMGWDESGQRVLLPEMDDASFLTLNKQGHDAKLMMIGEYESNRQQSSTAYLWFCMLCMRRSELPRQEVMSAATATPSKYAAPVPRRLLSLAIMPR